MRQIAALYVQTGGAYYGLEGVDPWDEARDARHYMGPDPVVAHPPCTRWCRLAGLVEARWGHKKRHDEGTFKSALFDVRRWGGVLEHPAYSDAWAAFDLPRPDRHGGWAGAPDVGWSCHVEQCRYGHPAKKATWLYVASRARPAEMRWGSTLDSKTDAPVSWCGNRTKSGDKRRRLTNKEAIATPVQFREALISLARSVVI